MSSAIGHVAVDTKGRRSARPSWWLGDAELKWVIVQRTGIYEAEIAGESEVRFQGN